MKHCLIILFSVLIAGCGTNKPGNTPLEQTGKSGIVKPIQQENSSEERMCNCNELGHKSDGNFYLEYKFGEASYYTGKCKLTRENGNGIIYKYQNGHILEIIERYPEGTMNEEMYYDLTGKVVKRVRYYPNGTISYKDFHGDHSFESFYENGKIKIKGFYTLPGKDAEYRRLHKFENTLFDSTWKSNGQFDSVCHYSEADITY